MVAELSRDVKDGWGLSRRLRKVEEAEGVEAEEVRKAVRVAGWGLGAAERAGSPHHR